MIVVYIFLVLIGLFLISLFLPLPKDKNKKSAIEIMGICIIGYFILFLPLMMIEYTIRESIK
jgi:RsiW-degrading membrane proteinase PrsW (M82 family)